MDRVPWLKEASNHQIPWPCPHCGQNKLYVDEEKILSEESAESKKKAEHQVLWEEHTPSGTYSAILSCRNCKQFVISTGNFDVEHLTGRTSDDEEEESVEFIYFYPKFFDPPLRFFNWPQQMPKELETILLSAFQLYWINPNSCASKVRSFIEELLTIEGIAKRRINKNKKRIENIWLNERLLSYKTKNSEVYEILDAIKLIGNDATHAEGSIERNDCLDAFELLAAALVEIFAKPKKRVKKIIKKIRKQRARK